MLSVAARVPTCIGIILDGNRRWAKSRGLPTLVGHKKGYENFVEVSKWVRDAGIKHFAVFAFSTENWNRGTEEVAYLLDLFMTMAVEQTKTLNKENLRVRFVGQRERFSPELQNAMQDAEETSKNNTACTVWICLSYGGRAEIVEAARKLQKDGVEITEESLRSALWTAEMPDPDLIIRTSGEHRLSGFLTWTGVYSELFFVNRHWPEFSKEDLHAVLSEYAERERRMGK